MSGNGFQEGLPPPSSSSLYPQPFLLPQAPPAFTVPPLPMPVLEPPTGLSPI